MQDHEHPTLNPTDEASEDTPSALVRINPGGMLSSQETLPFARRVILPWADRLIQWSKAHTQLFIGAGLGAVATFFLSTGNSTPLPLVPFQGLALEERFNDGDGLFPRFASGHEVPAPLPAAPPSPPPPGSQLQFVDRFYFTAASGEQPQDNPQPTWLMVDRFYLDAAMPLPGAAQPLSGSPLPWVWPQALSRTVFSSYQGDLPGNPADQDSLAVPPPPTLPIDSVAPLAYGPLSDAERPSPAPPKSRHTLLGIVQTNQFGAALVKTDDSSYSVRVGDQLRQSNFRLTALEPDRAILSNGGRTFIVSVGEQF